MDPHLQDGVAVPTIVGLLNWLKLALPDTAKKWLPLVAIGLGVGYAFAYKSGLPTGAWITTGFTLGLAAAGVYDGARALLRKKGEPGDTTVRHKPPTS
jgi:hypothetical protein